MQDLNFTVIIPTLGRYDFLLNALDSVFKQSLSPVEIIVINDNFDYLSLPLKYSSVRIINSGGHKGAPYCRNLGISVSTSNYIAFLDDDDLWKYNHLEVIKGIIYKTNCEVVSSSFISFFLLFGHIFYYKKYTPNAGAIYSKNSLFGCSSMVVKRDLITRIGLFDIHLKSCQDWDLWIRFFKENSVLKINNDGTVLIRRHLSPSISKSFYNRYKGLQNFYFKNRRDLKSNVLSELFIARYYSNKKNITTLFCCKNPIGLYLKFILQRIKYFIVNAIN